MTTEYQLQCRFGGGYKERWSEMWTYRGEEGLIAAKTRLAANAAAPQGWEFRIVSREVTEWIPLEEKQPLPPTRPNPGRYERAPKDA